MFLLSIFLANGQTTTEKKRADILNIETDDYRQIAYEFGGNFVGKIIKKGREIR